LPGVVSAPVLAYGPRARSSYVIDNLEQLAALKQKYENGDRRR
jgi:hypothetical protein